jgi:hypothetical protein
MLISILVIVAIIIGVFPALVADYKGYDFYLW